MNPGSQKIIDLPNLLNLAITLNISDLNSLCLRPSTSLIKYTSRKRSLRQLTVSGLLTPYEYLQTIGQFPRLKVTSSDLTLSLNLTSDFGEVVELFFCSSTKHECIDVEHVVGCLEYVGDVGFDNLKEFIDDIMEFSKFENYQIIQVYNYLFKSSFKSVRTSDWESLIKLFYDLRDNRVYRDKPCVDESSYCCILEAASGRVNQVEVVNELVRKDYMQSEGYVQKLNEIYDDLNPDFYVDSALEVYDYLRGNVDDSVQTLRLLDVSTYNSIFEICVKAGRWDDVSKIFSDFIVDDVIVNDRTCSIIMNIGNNIGNNINWECDTSIKFNFELALADCILTHEIKGVSVKWLKKVFKSVIIKSADLGERGVRMRSEWGHTPF